MGAREVAQQKQRDAEDGRRSLEKFASQLTAIGAANNRDEGVEVRRCSPCIRSKPPLPSAPA